MSYLDLLVIIFVALGLLFGLCGKASRKIFRLLFVIIALGAAFLSATFAVDEGLKQTPGSTGLGTEIFESEEGSLAKDVAFAMWRTEHDKEADYELSYPEEQDEAYQEFLATSYQEIIRSVLAPGEEGDDIFLRSLYDNCPEYKGLVDGNLFGIVRILIFFLTGIVYLIVIPFVGMFIVGIFTMGKKGRKTAVKTLGLASALRQALIWAFIFLPISFLSPIVKPALTIALAGEDNQTLVTINSLKNQYLPQIEDFTQESILKAVEDHYTGSDITKGLESEGGSFIVKAEVAMMSKEDAPIVSVTTGENGSKSTVNFFNSFASIGVVAQSGYDLYTYYSSEQVQQQINELSSELETMGEDLTKLKPLVEKLNALIGTLDDPKTEEDEGTGFMPHVYAFDEARKSLPKSAFLNGLINGLLEYMFTELDWSSIPDLVEEEGGEGGSTVSNEEIVSGLLELAEHIEQAGLDKPVVDYSNLSGMIVEALSALKPYFADMSDDSNIIVKYTTYKKDDSGNFVKDEKGNRVVLEEGLVTTSKAKLFDNTSIDWNNPSILDDIFPRIMQSAMVGLTADMESEEGGIDIKSLLASIKFYDYISYDKETNVCKYEWADEASVGGAFARIIEDITKLAEAAANAAQLASIFSVEEGQEINYEDLAAAMDSLADLPDSVAETINEVVNSMVGEMFNDVLPEGTELEIDVREEAAMISALSSNIDALQGGEGAEPLTTEQADAIVSSITESALVETLLDNEDSKETASGLIDQFVTSDESKEALQGSLQSMIDKQAADAIDPTKTPEEQAAAQEMAAKYAQYMSLFQTTPTPNPGE